MKSPLSAEMLAAIAAAVRELRTAEPSAGELTRDRLWTQREAARYLGVSDRYLRESSCPKVLLPGNGAKGQRIVRYEPAQVDAWKANWSTSPSSRSVA